MGGIPRIERREAPCEEMVSCVSQGCINAKSPKFVYRVRASLVIWAPEGLLQAAWLQLVWLGAECLFLLGCPFLSGGLDQT